MESPNVLSASQIIDNISIIDNATGQKRQYSLQKYTQSHRFHSKNNESMSGGDYSEQLTTDTERLQKILMNKINNSSNSHSPASNQHGGLTDTTDTEQLQQLLSKKIYGDSAPIKGGKKESRLEVDKSDSEDDMYGGNEALDKYRKFVEYVQKKLGLKGGPVLQKFASSYKKKAETELDKNATLDEKLIRAKELFDNDKNAQKKYDEFSKEKSKKTSNKQSNSAKMSKLSTRSHKSSKKKTSNKQSHSTKMSELSATSRKSSRSRKKSESPTSESPKSARSKDSVSPTSADS
jgi:hypothetical protein